MTDEEEDNPYSDEEEEGGTDALNVQALAPEVIFERPDLQNALLLRTPASRKRALEVINSQPVSAEFKQAIAEWELSHMNEDVILADFTKKKSGLFNSIITDPQEFARLKAELDLEIKLLSACKADHHKPWYNSVIDDLMFPFTAFVSRTSGPQRERLRNGVIPTETEVKSITGKIETPQQPKKKKRGL